MKAIPRKYFEHTVSYEATTGNDADGNGTYATAVSLFFVRCEPVKSWVNVSNGEMKDDKLTLFYDCVNSEPAGLAIAKGDRITFNGAAYVVREVKDFSPHHLEVALK